MDLYLYDAVRTPRAKARPDGTLAAVIPPALVAQLVAALDQRGAEASTRAGQLVLGCVGQIGAQGGNLALVSKLHAGLPDAVTAYTVNNYCVSGLSAIGLAAGAIATGVTDFALAGGVECMSRVPFMGDRADYYTDATLPQRTRYVPVAVAADRLAVKHNIGRAELDAITLRSHQRAAAAQTAPGLNHSLVPVRRPDGGVLLDHDEGIRADLSAEKLAALKPAFGELAGQFREALGEPPPEPRHTVAHAPGMVDGAALALVGRHAHGARPRARILAYAECGGDPQDSLTAGFAAMDSVLQRAGLNLSHMDHIEFMEAFAVVPVLFLREREVDPARVNAAGGHLAKGHPLGATGAILVSSLLDALEAGSGSLGLVVATGASGIGAAMVLERVG